MDVCKSIHNFMELNINKARISSFSSHLKEPSESHGFDYTPCGAQRACFEA